MINNSLPLPQNAIELVKSYLLTLQDRLCQRFTELDTQGHFIADLWHRPQGGGGDSRILTNGAIFEKAGVNFSQVSGHDLPASATATRPELRGCHFDAMGVSVVIHPHNPFVPTTHANVRFFRAETADKQILWWFGGGFDLTPYYGFVEDCKHWHATAKRACDPFGEALYAEFKAWCDRYFFLKHRNEARGIGGLFFDDYHRQSFDHSFGLMQSIGSHFIEAYAPIVEKRKTLSFSDQQKDFQLYRRGRYVEYNLVYDRGTLFGLQSDGRTESILISLPPVVHWTYNWLPQPDSMEEALYKEFLPVRDWLC